MPQNSSAVPNLDQAKPNAISWLFTIAIFVGSALLFLVQPMVAKMLLPTYGGTPAVWNTSMVFFQAALLLGYGYAHLSFKLLGPKLQPAAHLAVLGLAALTLPIAFGEPSSDFTVNPSFKLLAQLAVGIGLPFVFLSAGAPLLQRWYASTRGPGSQDPYFLYSASNLASILALLSYPLLFEPLLRLREQSMAWTIGYGVLFALVMACGATVLLGRRPSTDVIEEPFPSHQKSKIQNPKSIAASPSKSQVLYWIALSFVPSSLLLGVTTYLTTNIASAPLLWVLPLSLYLLTFVMAFSARRKFSSQILGRIVSILIPPMVLVTVLEASDPILVLGSLHLIVFTLGALMCHTRLNETRPDSAYLTAFYFWISVGGVLGGIFNALLAPVLFDSIAEYPIALVALVLLVPSATAKKIDRADLLVPVGVGLLTAVGVTVSNALGLEPSPVRTAITLGVPALASFVFAERPVRFGLSLGAVFLAASLFRIGTTGELIRVERSFFGVHRVLLTEGGRFRELMHGNTIHGRQSTDPARSKEALTYYYRTGPIGQVFEAPGPTFKRVGLVGMGVGSLATYGKTGQRFEFYEIDPVVVDIARDSGLFTFIRNSEAKVETVLGDARLSLVKADAGAYDLLVLDAFSSDAIPTHLLTVEAIKMYLEHLAPSGIMAFHTSNRFLQLEPVLAAAARDLGLTGIMQQDTTPDDSEKQLGKFPSTWVLLSPSQEALKPVAENGRWLILESRAGDRAWTDDFSNLVEAFLASVREPD